MKAYMRAVRRLLPGETGNGFLFPQFVTVQGVVRCLEPFQMESLTGVWIHHYLKRYHIDAGETLHGFRSGAMLQKRFEGLSQAEAAAAIGWKTATIAEHYAKFEQVMQHSGFSSEGLASLSVDAQSVLYMRTNALQHSVSAPAFLL